MKYLFTSSLLSLLFSGCLNTPTSTDKVKVNPIPPKKTYVTEESSATHTSKQKRFRSDDHRFDDRYRNFDYDRYGYYSNNGLYYGYFDENGYFYNNMYFTYDQNHTYAQRYQRIGPFSPDEENIRVYLYHPTNDWNKEHHYAQPNQYVGQFLYYETDPRPRFRVYHLQEKGPGNGSLTYQGSEEDTQNRQQRPDE